MLFVGSLGIPLWIAQSSAAAPQDEASNEQNTGAATGRPTPVAITPAVEQPSYQRLRNYTGSFVAARQTRLAFERQGKIVRMMVDEGDAVTADQPLAELDRRHLTAQRRAAAARLGEAQAVLEELVAGPRKERIAAAEAAVRRLSAQRSSIERNLARRRKLVETRAISREEYDDALYSFRAAEAQVSQAEEELNELVAGTRKEQIAAQRSRVDQLQAEVADIDHDLEDTTLRAPYAGVVAERMLDEGAIVSAGEAVVRLVASESPELWVGLPPLVAGRLSVGDQSPALISGRQATVTVRSLRPELDQTTRTRNVVFLPTTVSGAVPGQIGRVSVGEQVNQAGFWAPTDALTPRGRGLWAVYVAEGNGPHRTVAARDVEVLHNDGDRSFVRGALSAGEKIIATGAHRVVEGQRVRVSETPSG